MNNRKKYKQIEYDEFDGELNDKKIELEKLKFSTLPLLYMTEDTQKDFKFYGRAVEINGMAIEWDVFVFCDGEIIQDAT